MLAFFEPISLCIIIFTVIVVIVIFVFFDKYSFVIKLLISLFFSILMVAVIFLLISWAVKNDTGYNQGRSSLEKEKLFLKFAQDALVGVHEEQKNAENIGESKEYIFSLKEREKRLIDSIEERKERIRLLRE